MRVAWELLKHTFLGSNPRDFNVIDLERYLGCVLWQNLHQVCTPIENYCLNPLNYSYCYDFVKTHIVKIKKVTSLEQCFSRHGLWPPAGVDVHEDSLDISDFLESQKSAL